MVLFLLGALIPSLSAFTVPSAHGQVVQIRYFTQTFLSCSSHNTVPDGSHNIPVNFSIPCQVTTYWSTTENSTGKFLPLQPSPKPWPSGGVVLTSSGAGTFSRNPCPLNANALPNPNASAATCITFYTPSRGSEGQHIISACYPGDSIWPASCALSVALTVTARTTSTSVVCGNPVKAHTMTLCTSTTSDATTISTGGGIAIGGTDALSTNAGFPGTFGPVTCTPGSSSSGTTLTCSATYTPAHSGTEIIYDAYSGEYDHKTSTGQFTLTVT